MSWSQLRNSATPGLGAVAALAANQKHRKDKFVLRSCRRVWTCREPDQVRLKLSAQDLISFQERGMAGSVSAGLFGRNPNRQLPGEFERFGPLALMGQAQEAMLMIAIRGPSHRQAGARRGPTSGPVTAFYEP